MGSTEITVRMGKCVEVGAVWNCELSDADRISVEEMLMRAQREGYDAEGLKRLVALKPSYVFWQGAALAFEYPEAQPE